MPGYLIIAVPVQKSQPGDLDRAFMYFWHCIYLVHDCAFSFGMCIYLKT